MQHNSENVDAIPVCKRVPTLLHTNECQMLPAGAGAVLRTTLEHDRWKNANFFLPSPLIANPSTAAYQDNSSTGGRAEQFSYVTCYPNEENAGGLAHPGGAKILAS